jgi:hypothetical protein
MTDYRPPYGQAALATGAVLLLYVVTLGPTTWFWDTSEYIATAHILGIPHPPGNPLFVILGKAWSLLLAPTGLSVAIRINLLAAVTSAVATGFLFLAIHRVLLGWVRGGSGPGSRLGDPAGKASGTPTDEEPRAARRRRRREGRGSGRSREGRGETQPRVDASPGPQAAMAETAAEPGDPWTARIPLIGAWAGGLLAATAFTVWNQSNVNEKVYTLSVIVIAAVVWLSILWKDRKDEPGAGWLLVLAVYLMVLGSTNHLMSLLPAPALGLLILVEKPGVLLDRRILARGMIAVLLGLSFNFILPIRSAQQPVINEGEPVCEAVGETVVAIYTLGARGCPALASNLTREQYAKPPLDERMAPIGHQFANYFQYFDWQWARGLDASTLPGNRRMPFTLVFLGLGLWGLVVAWRSDRGHFLYFGTLVVTLTLALVYYLNFRYGYSLAPEHIPREMREVRERDYFFIASFHLWGGLAGMGLAAAWRWAAGGAGGGRGLVLASPVLLLALVPLVLNWGWADRSGDYSARDWAYNVLQSVEPYGIIFTNGDNDTFPLWYLQEVEGIRQDVTVIVVQYLYTQWYPRQLRYHTSPGRQRSFEPDERVAGIYEAPAQPPTRAITTLTDEQLGSIGYTRLGSDQVVVLGDRPVLFPAGTELGRGEQIALAIIRDSLDERPIHFASTAGLAQDLGLDRWAVRQGMASRLRIEDLDETAGVVRVAGNLGGDWVDVGRTLALSQDVFMYRGYTDRAVWADRATLNIPWHFYFMKLQLADAAMREGHPDALVDELLEAADAFAVTATGGTRGSM